MKAPLRHSYRAMLMASATAAIALPAFAQEQEIFALEEIVVTAQKREQSLQDVPSSVAAVSGEKLSVLNAAGTDIRFLSARVPSLTIESSFGRTFPRFYIRGLGNTDFDLNASQPVSLIYDEVVLENPILKGAPAFDLERIEVLRGPQGTLFGRNTPAGIVKFDSKKPTHELDAYGKFTYGRFDTIEFEGAVGGPIIEDILAARVSVRHQHREDYVNNINANADPDQQEFEGYDDFAGRFQLLYTPSENFSALLNFHARSLDGTARVFRANIIRQGEGGLVEGFDRRRVNFDGRNDQELDQRGVNLKMDYDFGDFTLTSISAFEHGEVFSRGDIDGGFGAVFAGVPSSPGTILFDSQTSDAVPDLDQWTQELRIASNDLGRVDFQAGFFYFNEDLRIETVNYNTFANNAVNGFAAQRQKSESWGIFGNVNIEVTDDIVIEGGVRYSEDDKDFVAERTLSPFGAGPLGPLTTDPSDEVLSWDVSATYILTDDISFYTRAAKSFRAPSIQGRVLFANDGLSEAQTEEIFSVEAGVKSELLNRRLRLNISAYYSDVDNQQVTAVGGDTNTTRLINLADTDLAGIEADLEWVATENLLITAGGSYNYTEINDPNAQTQFCGTGFCTVTDPVVNGFANIDGNDLPQAPRWIANWTARYSVPVGDDGEVYFYTDWAYTSKKNFFLYEAIEFTGRSELIGGLRLGYTTNDSRYDFAVFGRNITDQTRLKGAIDFNNLTGYVNEPAIWGIEAGVRF